MVILMCLISGIKCPNSTIIIIRAKISRNTRQNSLKCFMIIECSRYVHLKSCIRDSNLCSSTLYVRYSSCYNQCGDYSPETTSNDLVNHYILLINWVSLCPFYQQLYSPVEKNQKYAKIASNNRKKQQKHQVENFGKKYCSFSYLHIEKFKRK